MKKVNEKIIEIWNEDADSDWYMRSRTDDFIKSIIGNPISMFHQTTWEVINSVFPDLKGKKICVPSSGDNEAVFAFAALGAKVTSCDICEKQLEHAKRIANNYSFDVEFVLQNTMELIDIKSSEYDFIYTSEGVHVWIDDLFSMYKNIYRVLKPGGVYINYEIHPFGRPFKDELGKIHIEKLYENTGPFSNGTNYHWRLQDIINAITISGFIIKRLEEMHDEKDKGHFWFYEDKRAFMTQEEIEKYYNWETNPLAALPQWFTVYAVK